MRHHLQVKTNKVTFKFKPVAKLAVELDNKFIFFLSVVSSFNVGPQIIEPPQPATLPTPC